MFLLMSKSGLYSETIMCRFTHTTECTMASAESLRLWGCLGHRHYFIGKEYPGILTRQQFNELHMYTVLQKSPKKHDFEAPGPGIQRKVHPIEPGTPVSVHVLFRWIHHLDRSPSETEAKKRGGILAYEKYSPR